MEAIVIKTIKMSQYKSQHTYKADPPSKPQENQNQLECRTLNRLVESLTSHLKPQHVISIMALKNHAVSDVCKRIMLKPNVLIDWASGRVRDLPTKQQSMLELILGIEHGKLLGDRAHFLDLDENKIPEPRLSKYLINISSMFHGARKTIVCDSAGKINWFGGSLLYVVDLNENATVIISHTPYRKLAAQAGRREGELRSRERQSTSEPSWTDGLADSPRGRLCVSPNLAAYLRTHCLQENDHACQRLASESKEVDAVNQVE